MPPAALVGLAGLVVGLTVGAVILLRRSRRQARLDRAVAEGRLFTTVLDLDEIKEQVADAARRLTGAASARLAMVDDAAYIVSQVARTAEPATAVVDGESVMSVPCLVHFRVVAVVVVRGATDRHADELLAELASFIGPAVVAAEEHGHAIDVDALTGAFNRRRLDRDLARVRPSDLMAMIMIDIDHFKRFNDRLGHAAGDAVLRAVSRVVRRTVRADDVVYRYGGEEFSVLLPMTTLEEAARVSERVRAAVATTVVTHEGVALPPVTISAGVAVRDDGDTEALARAADAALYEAKEAGRNRVAAPGWKKSP